MKLKCTKVVSLATALITFGSLAGGANGAVTILVQEVGGDVVFSWGGAGQSLDLTGAILATTSTFSAPDQITANVPELSRGRTGVSLDYYRSTSSSTFGAGGLVVASSGSGGPFGLGSAAVGLPSGYVSGNTIAPSSLIFDSTDFVTLGITPTETTVLTLPNDSIEMTFVPEPSSALLLGLGSLGCVTRRRRNS